MKFSDFFVPKYLHSNPEMRLKFINKSKDISLLKQIAKQDQDQNVCKAAMDRVQAIEMDNRHAA